MRLADVVEHGPPVRVRPSNIVATTPRTLEVRVGEHAHVVDGLEQLPDAAMAQRLALQRDEDLAGGRQAVDGQHARATAGSR